MRGFAALALWGMANLVAAATNQPTTEAEAQARIDQVRAEIVQLTTARAELIARRDAGIAALREIDRQVGVSARRLHELNVEIDRQNRLLAEREAERVRLARTLRRSREKLARLIHAAYRIGYGESFKALLARDRIEDSQRALAYYRYLQRDLLAQVRELTVQLQSVLELERSVAATRSALDAARDQERAQTDRLVADRARRQAVLAQFDAALTAGATRIAALAREEQDLLRLLEQLRDVFADIPKQIEAALPFAALKGRLRRPHPASVTVGFGQPIAPGWLSEGWWIAAQVGDEVRAVAPGRVAFADWLKGFGLLLILDHGDGYMSLYAHNEALLKDVGDWVAAGEVIGMVGASGGVPSPGLYFELRQHGRPLDPKPWFPP